MEHSITTQTKLLDALHSMYPDSSSRTLRSMLKNKRITVDGTTCIKGNLELEIGQTVSSDSSRKILSHRLEVVYEDKDIIIINKPEGLLSVPLDAGSGIHALGILRANFKSTQISAVHRIDKGTSGVMIFSRSPRSKKILDQMFRKHDFTREYIAVVQGNVVEAEGTWTSRLVEGKNCSIHSSGIPDEGKLAITHYAVMRRSKLFSFLKITLETGRKHQIRVHCKDAGHPIAGDKRYGLSKCNPISRICLHASALEFLHPFTGKSMHFAVPLPSSFVRLGMNG